MKFRSQSIATTLILLANANYAFAAEKYTWSPNQMIAPPSEYETRIQAETALATDAQQRVWLSFQDCDSHRSLDGTWLAWPRNLRLFLSEDQGQTFASQPDLERHGGSESMATDSSGVTYCSYIHTANAAPARHQDIQVKQLPEDDGKPYYPFNGTTDVVASHMQAGLDGALNVVAKQRSFRRPKVGALSMLFARSTDGGKTWKTNEVPNFTALRVVETKDALFAIDTYGYTCSKDNGATFPEPEKKMFGNRAADAATNSKHDTLFVVGDSIKNGLHLLTTSDQGKTWNESRIDDAKSASAWRYPAILIDKVDRIHVVWMDDRTGYGALYHAYSDDSGKTFSANEKISDKEFAFPVEAPFPPPADQSGKWIGNYLSITTVGDKLVTAWSDQRTGLRKSIVYVSVGTPEKH